MPYRRTKSYKKRKYFRKGFDRAVGYYGRYNKGGPERKFHDVDLLATPVGSTISPTIFQLALVAAGTGEQQRIGRKSVFRMLMLRFMMNFDNPSADVGSQGVRVMLVVDKQTNGVAAGISDIIDITGSQDFFAFNNLANKNRFRILMDRLYAFNRTAYTGVSSLGFRTRIHDFFATKMEIPIEFSGVTGAITEIRSNNLFMIIFNQNGAAGVAVDFVGKCRSRFTDG